jgi:diacylglycerol kinase (ATP)
VSSPFGPLRVIVNPHAGRGAVSRNLPRLTAALDEHGLVYDVAETSGPRDATAFARQALEDGFRYLVAVGGDGTVHEVVNGMFDGAMLVRDDAVLGVVTGGSGGDFVRTFGLDRDPEIVARHLATDHVLDVDMGLVDYTDLEGRPATRVFANIAEVGYGAHAVRLAASWPRWIGRFRYLFAAWGAIRAVDRQDATVSVAHTDRRCTVGNLIVANCQFFGGGMKVAPRALPQDGKFNVQIFTGPSSQVFTLMPKIYRGEHLPHPDIVEYQSPTVGFAPPRAMLIEADGEVLGWTPARFRVLEQVLRLKI